MTRLDPRPHASYMSGLLKDMRDALVQFRKFDAKWNQLNEALNQKFEDENRDLLAIAQMKSANVTQQGNMAAAQWWRDKATMLGTVIQAEESMIAYQEWLRGKGGSSAGN